LPTSSFDTFFACTIIVTVALIGMAFLGSTMQTRITSTQDINKDSYLKAIADRIVTNPGSPTDWGTKTALPVDFGLASNFSCNPFELDMDKICRLNKLNIYSLSYPELLIASKLNNLALGIRVSQLITVNIQQSSNFTEGNVTSFSFTISTSIDSKPTSTDLRSYVAADTYLTEINSTISDIGVGNITIQVPTVKIYNALLIVFARSSLDDRLTSYAVYNFARSTQESAPSSTDLALSPLDYTLSLNDSSPGLKVQDKYVFSYSNQHTISSNTSSQTPFPKLIDQSPIILVVSFLNGTDQFQEWTAYPQVPLRIGANFEGSEQNIFSYIVSVNDVLFRLDLSLGDLPN
jgi:hypothetical protein